jgi:hypothetical protein
VTWRLTLLALAVLAVPARADDLLREAVGADAAIEERVRLVLVHRLAGDATALDADVADLAARDEAARRRPAADRPHRRRPASPPGSRRRATRSAGVADSDEHPDPLVRRLAEHRLEADDAETAERLLKDDRHNRRAAVLNDAVRPLGIFSGGALLAALNPFLLAGSAADSVITTAVNLWHYNRLSSPEREALARYSTVLERDPHTRDAPEIARAIRRLGEKRAEALCDATIRLAEKAIDEGDVDHAVFYAHAADRVDGCAERAARPIEKANALRTEHAAREEAGRWPVDDPPQGGSADELRDYHDLLVATALADPGAIIERASRFRGRHAESPFDASALYAIAVARDLAGHRAAARDALATVARDDDTGAGRRAAAVLASPDYDGLDAIREAERKHARDTARYVLLGGRLDGRTALYTASQFGSEGLRAAQSFGIFNVIGVATRAWQAWRKDPVSNQAIIDRGETVLARDPRSPDASAVHARLADATSARDSTSAPRCITGRAPTRAEAHREARGEARRPALPGRGAERRRPDPPRRHRPPLRRDRRGRQGPEAPQGSAGGRRRHARARGARGVPVAPFFARARPAPPRRRPRQRRARRRRRLAVARTDPADPLQRRRGRSTRKPEPRPEKLRAGPRAADEALRPPPHRRKHRDPDTGLYERYIPIYLQGTVDDGGVYVYPG